jgi:integrase
VGREGFEPSTLGLRVPPGRLELVGANPEKQGTKRVSAPTSPGELEPFPASPYYNPYAVLALVALKTGGRLGELLALTWADVALLDGVLRVRRTYTDGFLDEPKTHERRDVDLSPEVVELLGAWWRELGEPGDDRLVFPGPTRSGYLNPKSVLEQLYTAMEQGEREPRTEGEEERKPAVTRVGPTGELRTFHSAPAHLREGRARERPVDHVAAAPARAQVDHGHDRPVRALGAGGTATRGRGTCRRLHRLSRFSDVDELTVDYRLRPVAH